MARALRSTRLRLLAALGAAAFIALQFVRPVLPAPAVAADLQLPPAVHQVLKQSCYDCHSNQTQLRWYDQIVPAYWLAIADVKAGRRGLNFSDLGASPGSQQRGALYEAVNQMQAGTMPPPRYTALHRDAVISPAQLAILKNYLASTETPLAAASTMSAKSDAQYERWIASKDSPHDVRPALNSVPFLPDYKNWTAISATERFDNHSMRLILGNDVAIAAAESGRTNPWPDGTALAKVAWAAAVDDDALVRPQNFIQVELMQKDSRKYAATRGWGWARWRGSDLAPYGSTAEFTNECVNCHLPVSSHDYVYTVPHLASRAGLPFDPAQWSVITSEINPGASTMSTLYGNDVAMQAARTGMQPAYPNGAVLALVTWSRTDDDRWFGARVPDVVESVEFVSITTTPDHRPTPRYEPFGGAPLKPITRSDEESRQRIKHMLGARASVMP